MKLYSLGPLFILSAVIIGAITIAAIYANYQRITNFMEAKYINKSSNQIDSLYLDPLKNIKELKYIEAQLEETKNLLDRALGGDTDIDISIPELLEKIIILEQQIAEGDYYNDNIVYTGDFIPSTSSYPAKDADEDYDNDGLSNKEELVLGTDCRSPDTDGDGVSDGTDADPLDFNIGGINTTFSFDPTITPTMPTGNLVATKFYKNVINITTGETKWQNYIKANPNDLLKFLIYIELENTHPSETKSATLYDIFQTNEFAYKDNLQLFINNIEQPYSSLLDQSWYNGYNISVPPTETKTYEIYFTATVKTTPSYKKVISNIAKLDLGTDYKSLFDQVFVGIPR